MIRAPLPKMVVSAFSIFFTDGQSLLREMPNSLRRHDRRVFFEGSPSRVRLCSNALLLRVQSMTSCLDNYGTT